MAWNFERQSRRECWFNTRARLVQVWKKKFKFSTIAQGKGFDRDGVSFGGATAFLATIEAEGASHDCAVLIPDLTRHEVSWKLSLEFLGNHVHSSMAIRSV